MLDRLLQQVILQMEDIINLHQTYTRQTRQLQIMGQLLAKSLRLNLKIRLLLNKIRFAIFPILTSLLVILPIRPRKPRSIPETPTENILVQMIAIRIPQPTIIRRKLIRQ